MGYKDRNGKFHDTNAVVVAAAAPGSFDFVHIPMATESDLLELKDELQDELAVMQEGQDNLLNQIEELNSRTDYLLGYLCGLAVGVALLFLNVIILHN